MELVNIIYTMYIIFIKETGNQECQLTNQFIFDTNINHFCNKPGVEHPLQMLLNFIML